MGSSSLNLPSWILPSAFGLVAAITLPLTLGIPWKDWQNPDPEDCVWELPLPGTKQIWETYVFDTSTKEWTYRIVDPARIGQPGSGYYQDGWCIWEENIGKKE